MCCAQSNGGEGLLITFENQEVPSYTRGGGGGGGGGVTFITSCVYSLDTKQIQNVTQWHTKLTNHTQAVAKVAYSCDCVADDPPIFLE